MGLWVLGKNKTQILRRLKAVAAEIIAEKEQIIDRAGALRFTASEQAQLKKVLTNPIGWKKRFLKPLLLRLNAHMLDAQIPIYFPKGVTIEMSSQGSLRQMEVGERSTPMPRDERSALSFWATTRFSPIR